MTNNKGGRPTKYKEEYCEQMVRFFNREPWEEKTINKIVKGRPTKVKVKEACRFPTFEKFAIDIDVCRDTLLEWRDVHPAFSVAYKKCKAIQKEILIQNGIFGNYDTAFTIFLAKNVTDMRNDPVPEQEAGELEFYE